MSALADLGLIGEVPATADAWLDSLAGPTLFRVAGRDGSRARGVSTLMHGNEPSGLRGLHALVRRGATPAVDLLCFVGAVDAARAEPRHGHRALPGRRDLNRCFRAPWEGREGAVARDLLAAFRAARVEAIVDLHNNTGHNPPYGVGVLAHGPALGLTSLFAEVFVHSNLRLGALMEVSRAELPIVTIECGRAGDPAADARAAAGLLRYASLDELPRSADHVERLVDAVRVTVRPGLRLAFSDRRSPEADLTLAADIDRHNFTTLAAGTAVGWVAAGTGWPLEARDAEGRDRSRAWFSVESGVLVTRAPLVPIMMTNNPVIARSDCLFYVVRRVADALRFE